MPLFIHDSEADKLASELQALTKARSKSAVVVQALRNEIDRQRKITPLSDRLASSRAKVAAMGPTDPSFDMKRFSDELNGE